MGYTYSIGEGSGEHKQAKVAIQSDGTNVAMHNAIVQQPLTTVSPNTNLTIVILQAEGGFISKHNAVPICCPCPPLIATLVAQKSVVSSHG
ncbi:hypothetical protein TNCV_4377871 [Trichonephila clavipes]|nr:hypothetical protein TNCV_4377871 [Trichonephila clavipes]